MIHTERFASIGYAARRRPSGLLAPFVWLGGVVASILAVALGALLAVLTAAAVAIIALVAGALVFLAGLALRARRQGADRRRADDPAMDGEGVIEARKVDGAWVAYGWERQGR